MINGKWKTVDTCDNKETSTTIYSLLPSTKYKLRVRAYNYEGVNKQNGKFSKTLSVKTTGVTSMSYLEVSESNDSALLYWSEVKEVDGFYVEQYNNGRWIRIADIEDPKATRFGWINYTVSNLKSRTTYKFRVKAYLIIDGKTYESAAKTITVKTK